MAQTSYPHVDSPLEEPEWRRVARALASSGVVSGVLGEAEVTAGTGLDSSIASGEALVDGFLWENDAPLTVTHAAADPTNDRVDLIVLRYDPNPAGDGSLPGRVRAAIVTGTPAAAPAAPAPTQVAGGVWEIPLAERAVGAGLAAAGAIVDRRYYTSRSDGLYGAWTDHGAAGVAETFDASVGKVHLATLDANLTVSLAGWAAAGNYDEILIALTQDATGGRSVTWPAAVAFHGGGDGAPAVAGTTVYRLFTTDGGANVRATVAWSAGGSETFGYTGVEQTFIVPDGVSLIEVELLGGQGGDGTLFGTGTEGIGGAGGRVKGTLAVTPGETLWVRAGGAGVDGVYNVRAAGGWNGGGVGGNVAATYAGGGGAGASDIRQGGNANANRKAVAAGGGGGGADNGGTGVSSGGDGGAATGEAGLPGGSDGGTSTGGGGGGTATAGGAGGGAGGTNGFAGAAGSLATGGAGGDSRQVSGGYGSGGGGGAGYYGGGGGGGGGDGGQGGGGGGGGGNYTGGLASIVADERGVRTGPGEVVISW